MLKKNSEFSPDVENGGYIVQTEGVTETKTE